MLRLAARDSLPQSSPCTRCATAHRQHSYGPIDHARPQGNSPSEASVDDASRLRHSQAQTPSLMAAAHPSDLYPLVVSFLQKQGLAAAAMAVKEATKRTQVRADALPLRTCVPCMLLSCRACTQCGVQTNSLNFAQLLLLRRRCRAANLLLRPTQTCSPSTNRLCSSSPGECT
jgi:hypothetical protein